MEKSAGKKGLVMILIVYLAGIFMGAIDTGIVTPAREIIQNNFMVDGKTGIWMITIYTLAYAASIPVMGKLADRTGRKTIYIVSIFLFGLGSLLCGLSKFFGSFEFLVAARALQAIGGGGIVPIATAEFGTSFPAEKRGMALGLVGAVYGVANILGSLAGSAILDIFGTQNWEYIFFVNIPISLFIIIAGFFALPNNKVTEAKKIDIPGIILIVAMVLSLLYGIKNIDFFSFSETIKSTSVWPFLLGFVVLLPIFIFVEKKAADPVLNLRYFMKSRILIAMIVAFVAGFILMGIVFIPQFSENALKVPSGKGGYFTMILGLLSGVSAAFSGKLLDKLGAKLVLFLGFIISIVGALFLIFITAVSPNTFNVILSLGLLGLGLGFTMGAPVNYMMLENITDKEAASGLATLSLVRSVGTTIAPALMVGFIVHAGMSLQTNILAVMPNEIKIPELPYIQEISTEIDKLKSDPNMAEKLSGVDIPDPETLQTVQLDFSMMDGSVSIPQEMIDKFKTSDVTTITAITKEFAAVMFDQMSPMLITQIQGRVQSGLDSIAEGIAGMQEAVKQQQAALAMLKGYAPKLTAPLPAGMSLLDMIPADAKGNIPQSAQDTLKQITSPDELQKQIEALEGAIAALNAKIGSDAESVTGSDGESMTVLQKQMQALYDAIPAAFATAETNYFGEIDSRHESIETTYQNTLNGGYKSMYVIVAVSAAAAMVFLAFYRKKKQDIQES